MQVSAARELAGDGVKIRQLGKAQLDVGLKHQQHQQGSEYAGKMKPSSPPFPHRSDFFFIPLGLTELTMSKEVLGRTDVSKTGFII